MLQLGKYLRRLGALQILFGVEEILEGQFFLSKVHRSSVHKEDAWLSPVSESTLSSPSASERRKGQLRFAGQFLLHCRFEDVLHKPLENPWKPVRK